MTENQDRIKQIMQRVPANKKDEINAVLDSIDLKSWSPELQPYLDMKFSNKKKSRDIEVYLWLYICQKLKEREYRLDQLDWLQEPLQELKIREPEVFFRCFTQLVLLDGEVEEDHWVIKELQEQGKHLFAEQIPENILSLLKKMSYSFVLTAPAIVCLVEWLAELVYHDDYDIQKLAQQCLADVIRHQPHIQLGDEILGYIESLKLYNYVWHANHVRALVFNRHHSFDDMYPKLMYLVDHESLEVCLEGYRGYCDYLDLDRSGLVKLNKDQLGKVIANLVGFHGLAEGNWWEVMDETQLNFTLSLFWHPANVRIANKHLIQYSKDYTTGQQVLDLITDTIADCFWSDTMVLRDYQLEVLTQVFNNYPVFMSDWNYKDFTDGLIRLIASQVPLEQEDHPLNNIMRKHKRALQFSEQIFEAWENQFAIMVQALFRLALLYQLLYNNTWLAREIEDCKKYPFHFGIAYLRMQKEWQTLEGIDNENLSHFPMLVEILALDDESIYGSDVEERVAMKKLIERQLPGGFFEYTKM